jgi:predicted permease
MAQYSYRAFKINKKEINEMLFSIVIHQMILFFSVLLVGHMAARQGVIQENYLPELAKLVTKILLPVLFFYMTYAGTTRQMVLDNATIIGLAALFYAVICAVTWLLAKVLRPTGDKAKVFQFAFIFGNTGFVGAPLLITLFPNDGFLYLALFSIVDQLMFWTYGVYLATASDQKAKIMLKSFVNPNIVAIALAFIFIMIGVKLPTVVDDTFQTIKNAVGAISMIYLGALFFYSNWKDAFKTKDLYFGIVVKMIVIPILLGKLLLMTDLPNNMIWSMIILMSLPTMTVVPMIAKMHGHEGAYAAGITVGTLAISIVTIPLVVFFTM